MKKIILSLILILVAFPAFAFYDLGKPQGFVNDFTNTLTLQQKKDLEIKLKNYEKETLNEISVVLIPTLKGDYIENFAVKLVKKWGIGKSKKDNGILILIAKEDRKIRIEVGYGLEDVLTDLQSAWIINNLIKPNFKQENYFLGIDEAVNKIIGSTKGFYLPDDVKEKTKRSFPVFWVGIFVFLWLSSILGRSKSWWAGGVIGGVIGVIIGIIKGFLFIGIVWIGILIPIGLLFDYIVSKKYAKGKASGNIPWWIGGSGFGPGSDDDGFGGFGGGISGGGGASGDW